MPRFTLPLLFVLIAPTTFAAEKATPGDTMDYGPVFASALARVGGKAREIVAYKSLTIRLGDGAYVSFDTDLLRYAAGWTGHGLDLKNTHMTSPKGSVSPAIGGEVVFATKIGPGVSHKGSLADSRTDPARPGVGPLPREHGRFAGYYLNGDRVLLAYSAGGGRVLETPSFSREGGPRFSRTMRVEKTSEPLTIVLADDAAAGHVSATLTDAPAGAKVVSAEGGALHLTLPAIDGAATFTVTVSTGGGGLILAAANAVDPAALTAGGPGRWGAAPETAGQIGKPAGDFPYAVDTLTLPETPSWMRLTGVDFFEGGKSAAVCTWNGDVWVVGGIDESLAHLKWRRFATGLYEPLGLKVVRDVVYVLGRDQITRLHDLNGDGEADFYENFNNDAPAGAVYHHFKFGLDTDAAGNFYYSACGAWVENDLFPTHGSIARVSADGSRSEVIARGLRAPNGLAVGPDGTVVTSDNQGNWVPTSRIDLIPPGKTDGFYGFLFDPRYEKTFDVRRAYPNGPPTKSDPPVCWVPYAQDHSSGGQAFVTDDRWGPFKGNFVHTSYADARLFMVMAEVKDGGVPQGGLWRFPLTFESGIMRPRFNPGDGQLYVVGLRGWQSNAAHDGCFQRVRYAGGAVRQPRELRATAAGVSLTFDAPLDPASATDAGAWDVEQWNYKYSSAYGSPELSVENPTKKGHDTVEVKSARLSPDGRTVTLEMPGIKPVMQMSITYTLRSADGKKVEGVVYNTINKL